MKRGLLILPFLIIIGLGILFKKGIIHHYIKEKINSKFPIKITTLKGNLISTAILEGVEVGKKGMLKTPQIIVNYNILSVLRGTITKLSIIAPIIDISLRDTQQVKFPFNLKEFEIKEGRVKGIKDTKIRNLNLRGNFLKINNKITQVKIKKGKCELTYKGKKMKIDKLKLKVWLHQNKLIEVRKFSTKIGEGEVSFKGKIGVEESSVRLKMKKLEVKGLVENIKGELNLECKITKKKETKIEGNIEFRKVEYKNYFLGDIIADFSLKNKTLFLQVKNSPLFGGVINGEGWVNLENLPICEYNTEIKLERIQLQKVAEKLKGEIKGEIKVEGVGSKLQAEIKSRGEVNGINISHLYSKLLYSPKKLTLMKTKILQEGGEIFIKGEIEIDSKKLFLTLKGENINPSLFHPSIQGNTYFDFIVSGNITNPQVGGTFYFKNFKRGKIVSKYLTGNLSLGKIFPPQGETEIVFSNLIIGKEKLEMVKINVKTEEKITNYKLRGYSEELDLYLEGENKGEKFIFHTLFFNTPNIRITLREEMVFSVKNKQLTIKKCNLLLNDSLLQVAGKVSLNKLSLAVIGKNLPLNSFSKNIEGRFSLDCGINGTIKKPMVNLIGEVKDFKYSGVKVERILSEITYKNNCIYIEKLEAIQKEGGKLLAKGEIPIQKGVELMYLPLHLEVKMLNFGNITLPYKDFVSLNKVKINGKLKLEGKKIVGKVNMEAKEINLKKIQTKLLQPEGKILFEGEDIIVKEFTAKTYNRGKINIKGKIEKAETIRLNITGKNFPMFLQDPQVNTLVSMNLTLEGNLTTPNLEGEVKIEEAFVRIPLQSQEKRIKEEIPLNYKLKINFKEGKVWLNTPIVEGELIGEVEVKKEEDKFFTKGEVNMKEGYIIYYTGCPFKIKESKFRFKNSPVINPDINFLAYTTVNYTKEDTIRDTSYTETILINLLVKGTLLEPTFSFTTQIQKEGEWKEYPLPLEDIISLLSLNMKVEDLVKLEMEGTQTVMIRGISYTLMKSKFFKELKRELGVDALTLEKAELIGGKREVVFNVGKYVRKDLYVSYTQDVFSLSEYHFKAEYSPFKWLSFIGEREEGKLKAGIQFKIRY